MMRTPLHLAAFSLALALASTSAFAQQACPQSMKTGELDPAAIRRSAKAVAELKALLADPDADIRLLTIKQAVTSCDVTLRDTAIEFGLASNETAMVTAALRGTLTGRDALILRFNNGKDSASKEADNASWVLTIMSYDPVTGKLAGKSSCPYNDHGEWTGTVAAAAITFVTKSTVCSGRLDWNAEKAQFKGTGVLVPLGVEHPITWNPF